MITTSSPSISLQPRDQQVLSSLGEHGVLDTDLIHDHYFSEVSHRRCRQRLHAYAEHGLTRSMQLRLWTAECQRRAPMIHSLTERGVEVVEELTGIRPPRVSKGDPKPETIHHRLEIVRVKLVFDAAASKIGLKKPHWILEQDRDPMASIELPPSQRRILYHGFKEPPACTCQPDSACRLSIPKDIASPTSNTTDLLGYFEIDCSSEGRKQIVSKLPGYVRLIQHRVFTRYFPSSGGAVVRVFWVCRTQARIDSLMEVLGTESVAQFFRFTTSQELSKSTSAAMTSPIWQATDGKHREIIRLPNS